MYKSIACYENNHTRCRDNECECEHEPCSADAGDKHLLCQLHKEHEGTHILELEWDNEDAPQFLFTFGYGQVDPLTTLKLDNKYTWVVADNIDEAKQKMLVRFGNRGNNLGNWAFDYIDVETAGVTKYNLQEIDFITGLDI